MTTYKVQPINYFNENLFVPIDAWEIPNGSNCTIHFVLVISDSLGERRFIPPTGSQVSLSFTRARPAVVGSQSILISKNAVALIPTSDKSLFQVDLTSNETSQIITGGVKLTILMLGAEYSYSLPHLVKKNMSSPGF